MSKHDNVENLPPKVLQAYQDIVEFFAHDNDLSDSDLANFKDTPARAVKVLLEMTKTKTQISTGLKEILDTGFPMEAGTPPGLIVQGPISVHSWCPHHLLHVGYSCYIAYIPKKSGNVLGLSKLARIAKLVGERPVLQEQLVNDIADVLYEDAHENQKFPALPTQGSAVHLIGRHSCMSCRGVKDDALTSIAVMRGIFCTGELEQKFYQHINMINSTKL